MTGDELQRASVRLDDLEIKAAFQEQLLADLGDELVRHAERIAFLEDRLTRLLEHLEQADEDEPEASTPPHY